MVGSIDELLQDDAYACNLFTACSDGEEGNAALASLSRGVGGATT